jgi:L-asparaginase II
MGAGSPGVGITIKIADGDASGRARPVIAMAVLRHLGVLDPHQEAALSGFSARPIYNWRGLEVGEIRPAFTLESVAQ